MCAALGDGAAPLLAGAEPAPGARLPAYARTARARAATRVAFRLLAAVPPVAAGALSMSAGIDLDQILRWTGLIGVAIAFAIPALLRAAAAARTKAVFEELGQWTEKRA
jgi:hypothetical protein